MPERPERIVSIRQPAYLPGIVYFDQLLQADAHAIYDNVQYERRHYGNRNRIRSASHPNGWQWLTVPVTTKGQRDQWYMDTRIDNSRHWAQDHWKAILLNYARAPYFQRYADFFEDLYCQEWTNLADLDTAIIRFLNKQLGVKTKIVLASQLKTGTSFEDKNQRLIEIAKELGATTYVTVKGTSSYIDPEKFREANLTLLWHQFTHPVYSQFQGDFIQGMSVVDLLMNCGPDSGEIIRANMQKPTPTFQDHSPVTP